MGKTSGDSTRGVSTYIFARIQDSFTTQDSAPRVGHSRAKLGPESASKSLLQIHLPVKRPAARA
jgi:hypothetical protein